MISYAWFRTKFFTNSNSLTEHYVFLINEFRNTRPYHSINLNFLCIVEYWFPISQFSFFLCIQMHACEEIWLHLSVWDWVCKRFGLIIDKTVFVLIKGMFSDVAQIHYVQRANNSMVFSHNKEMSQSISTDKILSQCSQLKHRKVTL